jgi:hypothetical protein
MQRWLGCCAASATTVVAVQARHALVRRVALPDPRCGATSRTGECTHKLRPIGSGVPSVNFAGRQRPSPRHSSVEDGDGRRAKIVAGYRPRDGRDTSSCALLVARERRARQAQDSYSRRRRSIVCSGVERGEPCWEEGWTFRRRSCECWLAKHRSSVRALPVLACKSLDYDPPSSRPSRALLLFFTRWPNASGKTVHARVRQWQSSLFRLQCSTDIV